MRWDVTAGHVPVAARRRDGPSKSDIADDAAGDMQAAGSPPSGGFGRMGVAHPHHRRVAAAPTRRSPTPVHTAGARRCRRGSPSLGDRHLLISMKLHAVFKLAG